MDPIMHAQEKFAKAAKSLGVSSTAWQSIRGLEVPSYLRLSRQKGRVFARP